MLEYTIETCSTGLREIRQRSKGRSLTVEKYKGSVAKKKSLGVSFKGTWRQDELIGGKPPVVK
jgi:hypothetical protein